MDPLIDSILTDTDGHHWLVEVDEHGTWRVLTELPDEEPDDGN